MHPGHTVKQHNECIQRPCMVTVRHVCERRDGTNMQSTVRPARHPARKQMQRHVCVCWCKPWANAIGMIPQGSPYELCFRAPATSCKVFVQINVEGHSQVTCWMFICHRTSHPTHCERRVSTNTTVLRTQAAAPCTAERHSALCCMLTHSRRALH
jgi:hypothetical protein